jgi:multiple sugar transport system permease protein
VNSAAGYALARLRWRGRRTALALVLALLVIPFEAIAVPLFLEVTVLGWRDTYHVQILPFVANPLLVFYFATFFRGLPRELEEAARIDGAGAVRIFLRIAVPIARPAFASAAVLSFLMHWGSYLWPLMVTSGPRVRPLPVAIATFHTMPPRQWGDILAFGVMMVAPIVIAFLLFQKPFFRGASLAGSGK